MYPMPLHIDLIIHPFILGDEFPDLVLPDFLPPGGFVHLLPETVVEVRQIHQFLLLVFELSAQLLDQELQVGVLFVLHVELLGEDLDVALQLLECGTQGVELVGQVLLAGLGLGQLHSQDLDGVGLVGLDLQQNADLLLHLVLLEFELFLCHLPILLQRGQLPAPVIELINGLPTLNELLL